MAPHRIILAGNPNVGKSTVFNALTGLKQHTGNWSGKTVALAKGTFSFDGQDFEILDLPGTYSMISNSPEEEIARERICFAKADFTLVVADATCLSRNLNLVLQILEITPRVALCVNLLDEAEQNGILIDINALKEKLEIPVIGISARKRRDMQRLKRFLAKLSQEPPVTFHHPTLYPQMIEDAVDRICLPFNGIEPESFQARFLALKLLDNDAGAKHLLRSSKINPSLQAKLLDIAKKERDLLQKKGISAIILRDILVDTLLQRAKEIAFSCTQLSRNNPSRPSRIDRMLTSKRFGIPLMLCFLGFLLWLTISGANAPSDALMELFRVLKPPLVNFLTWMHLPPFWIGLLIDGVYQTTAWVTAVMLPPMLIFFPLFTLLEDLGYLPRLAFNLDRCFKQVGSCGKQALTMCMGLGCNAVGVTGCRIIRSRRERLAAMITNCFIPCNGRFSMLITLSTLFIGSIFCQGMQNIVAALFLLLLIMIGIFTTLLVTYLLTHFNKKEKASGFFLELPPFRKPQIFKTLLRSLLDRTLHILSRALRVSAPAGALIWLLANLDIGDISLLNRLALFLDPLGHLMGLDGMILLAFLLALPANEIVLPILLMGYLASGQMADISSLIALKEILLQNGWTTLTAINVMLFSLLHFPCGTTLWTIKKESGSWKWTILAFSVPTITAFLVCFLTASLWNLATLLL